MPLIVQGILLPDRTTRRQGHIVWKTCLLVIAAGFILPGAMKGYAQQTPLLQVTENGRFFQTADGKPFFWLGDTGWLLFHKTTREQAIHYLDVRKKQGFNVIQVMVLHSAAAKNVYGHAALQNGDIARPAVATAPDNYWNHIAFIVQEAAKRGIYMALVPVWGSVVRQGKVSPAQAASYGRFLAERFGRYRNIVWINGGDIRGTDGMEVWQTLAKTIKMYDPDHLVTFHPRGRYSSSEWFHQESWLDFNMFQSGHRTYAQDTSRNDKNHYGEDNWKYVQNDYSLNPVKPTLDGEPSYENIPYGLHDSLNPRWSAPEIRRYAYWSVFAGGAGFTYGENAVMQFHTKGDADFNYGVNDNWTNTINAAGATQIHHLKTLLLGKPYFERVPAQEIIADNNYSKYDYIVAARGKAYAFVYTYTGRNFSIDASRLGFDVKNATWFNPVSGKKTKAIFQKRDLLLAFDPPGEPMNGNDRVLILEGGQ